MAYLRPIHTSDGTTSEKRSERIQTFKAEFKRDDYVMAEFNGYDDNYFPIDLCDNSEKFFCEKLSNFAIAEHNTIHQHNPLELDEITSAKATGMNGKYMVLLKFNAITLDDQQKKIAFSSRVEYGIIDGEERAYVYAFTVLNRPSSSTPMVPLPLRTMTYQQWDRYHDQIKQSDGFDVEYTDAVIWSGQIAPIEEDEKDTCQKLAIFVTDDYYRRFQGSKGKLRYVELLRAMHQYLDGIYYYLTFMATSDEKDMRTCQAIVHVDFDGNTKVQFCRLETTKYVGDSLELLWDDRGRT